MDTQMLKGKAFFIWSKFYRSWTKTSLDMQFSRKSPEVGQKWDQSVGKLIKYLNWNVGSYCTNTGHHRCSWKNIEFWDLNAFASKFENVTSISLNLFTVKGRWQTFDITCLGNGICRTSWAKSLVILLISFWLAILDNSKSNSQVSVLGLVLQL